MSKAVQPPPAKRARRRRCDLESCGGLYTPKKPNQRFCKPEHRDEYHFKTETFRKTKDEVLKLVAVELDRSLDKLARKVFLILETQPPPALVARLADQLTDRLLRHGFNDPVQDVLLAALTLTPKAE